MTRVVNLALHCYDTSAPGFCKSNDNFDTVGTDAYLSKSEFSFIIFHHNLYIIMYILRALISSTFDIKRRL